MNGFDNRVFFLALLLVAFCAGCSRTPDRGTPVSSLLRLGRGDVGTGESITAPPPGSAVPLYYQEVGGGYRKQYCGLRADTVNTGN